MSSNVFKVTDGTIHGECKKCCEVCIGTFSSDDLIDVDDKGVGLVTMRCVSCQHDTLYSWVWPDGLPEMPLEECELRK